MYNRLWRRQAGDDEAAQILRLRVLIVVLGAVTTALACFVERLGPVFDICKKLNGAFAGPLLAVFVLALASKRARANPVLFAMMIGTAVSLFLTYGTKDFFFSMWFVIMGFVITLVLAYVGSVVRFPDRAPEQEP
jgi:Na+/proline symporter